MALAFAVDELNINNAFHTAQLQHDIVRNVIANSNRHNIGVGFRSAANLHAVDIDAGAAQNSCHLTDHIRLVDVRCQQQIAFWIEVNMILVDLYNLRLLAVEQGAFDFMCALGSSDFYIDSGSEVTWLVSLNLFNL